MGHQLEYTLADAVLSGVFAYAKKAVSIETIERVTPDKASTFLKGIPNGKADKIILDALFKELQFQAKGLEKVIARNWDPTSS